MDTNRIAQSEASGFPENDNARGQAGEVGRAKQRASGLSYPAPTSVKGRVLADLLAGDRLTHLDVWERHGSSRAAHHVLRLRQAGWPVTTEEINAPTKDGRIARIARYQLPAKAIEAAGDVGGKFIIDVQAARRPS
jgi:hypothetical protein